jgi:hypothetical protein
LFLTLIQIAARFFYGNKKEFIQASRVTCRLLAPYPSLLGYSPDIIEQGYRALQQSADYGIMFGIFIKWCLYELGTLPK